MFRETKYSFNSLVRTSLLVGPLLSWLLYSRLDVPSCRCRRHEPCWPSKDQWAKFNASVNGHLERIRPVGRVCHDPVYDIAACDHLRTIAGDSGWRASQPDALQTWIWESGSSANETCCIQAGMSSPCHQGRVPSYSVGVESVEEIQHSVLFAQRFNLRLIIRNSGHDLAGRGSDVPMGRAITCANVGVTIVGGDCHTVGVVGGYLQGGDVSPFFALEAGLAVDNALQFEVVTANGSFVVANQRRNQDLIWALRGGGGGTFGVVVRATMRSYSDAPAVVSELTINDNQANTTSWRHALAIMLEALQVYNRHHIGGQLVVYAMDHGLLKATLTMYRLGESDTYAADVHIQAYSERLREKGVSNTFSSRAMAWISFSFRQSPDTFPLDYGMIAGSVAVSNELFNSTDGPDWIAAILSQLSMRSGDLLFTSNLGGRVSRNRKIDTAMHPAWREAAQMLTYVERVDPSLDAKLAGFARNLDPTFKLSYSNVGDPSEPEFERVYWGPNYGRLREIKAKWDPEDLFIVRLGIGSEGWDKEAPISSIRTELEPVESNITTLHRPLTNILQPGRIKQVFSLLQVIIIAAAKPDLLVFSDNDMVQGTPQRDILALGDKAGLMSPQYPVPLAQEVPVISIEH
ncbi:hypothetical protein BDW72DRAFT_207693 [Aspergillus terricola var. indicus]